MKQYFSVLGILLIAIGVHAQPVMAVDTALHNIVRINITPLVVTSKLGSISVGYERVLRQHQSISANIGHWQLPTIITTEEGDPVHWIANLHNSGFLASVDYRFYFKRNRYTAPDGLYWGPYSTYYYLDNKARVDLFENQVAQGEAEVQTYVNMFIVGAQLGYQFVLGKRWTVDLILFGPGFGFYNLKVNLKSKGELIADADYLQGVYDALVAIFPAVEQLFDEQTIQAKGATSFNGLGYRMAVQVGFRF